MAISSIVFDLDGTLLASRESIVLSMQKVIPEATFENVPIGPKLDEIIRALRPDASADEVEEMKRRFRDDYDREGCLRAELFPHVRETLTELFSQGMLLSIATNKRKVPTEKILVYQGIRELFSQVLAIDSLQATTPKSEMIREIARRNNKPIAEHVMVGDSADDQNAAEEVGIPFWFASYGYGNARGARNLKSIEDVLGGME